MRSPSCLLRWPLELPVVRMAKESRCWILVLECLLDCSSILRGGEVLTSLTTKMTVVVAVAVTESVSDLDSSQGFSKRTWVKGCLCDR